MRLLYKLTALLVVVASIQFFVGSYLVKKDDEAHRAASFVAARIGERDVVLFGDSTLNSIAKDDRDRKTIPVLLGERIPYKIQLVQHGGFDATVYVRYVKYLVENNLRPRALVIPINLRSFSPQWDLNPSYEFVKTPFILNHRILGPSYFVPVSIFTQLFRSTRTEAWLNTPVYDAGVPAGTVRAYQGDRFKTVDAGTTRKKITYQYRYRLTEGDRRLAKIAEIIELCQRSRIAVLFYLTPVDVEFCDAAYPGTRAIVRENAHLVTAFIRSRNSEAADLSEAFPSKYFGWKDDLYPNEHLNDKGRAFLADFLARKITALGAGVASR